MHLTARQLVGCIVAANMVLDAVASPELEAKLAKDREPEAPLTTEQCQERLMKVLEENGKPWEVGWLEERDGPQGQAAPYGIPSHLQSGKE